MANAAKRLKGEGAVTYVSDKKEVVVCLERTLIPGDLLVTIRTTSHPSFRRDGLDLIVKVPVTLAEAALGAKVDVPTPYGEISLKVPPGTSSGTRLRAKGQGVGESQFLDMLWAREARIVVDRITAA